ncbi:hypothetical protein B0T10DRAFT_541536 [Thelonectria olida]|uniref:RelA/SpoT domain-containing protein n=1 Tax=Thelonectria olida TaxID=1576542 RepID=A0A9P8VPS8_9HYPO|nr:hypothetical protein B0T10DRAFT_541536 [Thelonectria olida]
MSLTLLSDFVDNYDLAFYTQVATLAEERCRKVLSESGIPAIITSRAKRPDRLLEKLKNRHKEKNYQTVDDIKKDLVDLSGVRIALYFPSQRREVELLLDQVFANANIKRLAGHTCESTLTEEEGQYRNEFAGYRATHLRLELGADRLSEDQQQYATSKIEIQVASLLMHAWSEVNHDLAYKTLNGALSIEEVRMLDGINGLMRTGEVMLGQLKASMETRIANQTRPFASQFEVGTFVQQYAPHDSANENYRVGSLSWLLYVLQQLKIDNSRALGAALDGWKSDQTNLTKYPIVHSIVGYLFETGKQSDDSLSSPLFLQSLNEKFKNKSETEQVSDLCHILAYACDPNTLGRASPGGHDEQLRNAGFLDPENPPKVSEDNVAEIKTSVLALWDRLAKHESVEARLALGIGRSRKAKQYWRK